MISPGGAASAAKDRQRQAVAGGLGSTVTGAGTAPGPVGATSGGKQLLGS